MCVAWDWVYEYGLTEIDRTTAMHAINILCPIAMEIAITSYEIAYIDRVVKFQHGILNGDAKGQIPPL